MNIDLDKLEMITREAFKARQISTVMVKLAEIRDWISEARCAGAAVAQEAEQAATAAVSLEDELVSMVRVKSIRDTIKPGDGWDGDDWDFALANAVAHAYRAQPAAPAVTASGPKAQLGIGFSNNDQGVHVNIMQRHADGSSTVLHAAKVPTGDSFASFVLAAPAVTDAAANAGGRELSYAILHLEALTQFAYQHGFHELGYSPVDTVRAALWPADRAPATSAGEVKDAERYRVLRDNALMGYPSAEGSSNKDAYLVVTGYGWDDNQKIVDEAVDTAISNYALRTQSKE